jgi:hypothetical protein
MLIRKIIISAFIISFIVISAAAQEENFKWKSISGKWRTYSDDSGTYLVETKIKTVEWGNSELINYNSIITTQPFEGITSLKISMRILNSVKPEVALMIFLKAENFRDFFAFRLTGTDGTLSRAQFISSKIKDPLKPPAEKWNYVITELGNSKCKIINDKDFKAEILIKGGNAVLFIDGEKILEGKADSNFGAGKFGFSCKNAALRLDDVKAYKDKDIIFEDDFSKDSMQRIVVKGTLEKVKN